MGNVIVMYYDKACVITSLSDKMVSQISAKKYSVMNLYFCFPGETFEIPIQVGVYLISTI